jgi:Amt family ammonium transporter
MFLDWHKGKPTILGAATGSVVGLVAITPAAGFVTPLAGIPIGIVASFVSYYSRRIIKQKMGVDDALDVFACHGLGSIWGMLATGIFASIAINASGANGAIAGNWMLIVKQMVAILAVGAYAFIVTMIIGKVIDVTMGLRTKPGEEEIGLDISELGERAYGGLH